MSSDRDYIDIIEGGNLKLMTFQDNHAENPVEIWDMLGELVTCHRNIGFGHKNFTDHEDYYAYIDENYGMDCIRLPVYMIDHSGRSISTSPFSCPWDSGKIGVMVATNKSIMENWSETEWSKELEKKGKDALIGEIKGIDGWLTGSVYAFILEKTTNCSHCGEDKTERIDECFGMYEEGKLIDTICREFLDEPTRKTLGLKE